MGTIADLNKKRQVTIVMVTHDPVASSFCSRVVFLMDGMIYSEFYRGDKSRQAYFKDIMDVQSVLGSDTVDVI